MKRTDAKPAFQFHGWTFQDGTVTCDRDAKKFFIRFNPDSEKASSMVERMSYRWYGWKWNDEKKCWQHDLHEQAYWSARWLTDFIDHVDMQCDSCAGMVMPFGLWSRAQFPKWDEMIAGWRCWREEHELHVTCPHCVREGTDIIIDEGGKGMDVWTKTEADVNRLRKKLEIIRKIADQRNAIEYEKITGEKMVASPVPYYGGKARLVNWIVPIIESYDHTSYIEPFGGGASVLLAKEPRFDVYNDVFSDIVEFFRILRSKEDFPEFMRLVSLMPCSREQFEEAVRMSVECEDRIERMANVFYVMRQAFAGNQREKSRGWKSSTTKNRCGISQVVNAWLGAVDRLPQVACRMLEVQVESMDAIDLIRKYAFDGIKDGKPSRSLIYCDPPYPLSTRSGGAVYRHELNDDQHRELVKTLLDVPGHKVVSTYECDLYKPLLDAGWTIERKDIYCTALARTEHVEAMDDADKMRTECLYCSPGRKPARKKTVKALPTLFSMEEDDE